MPLITRIAIVFAAGAIAGAYLGSGIGMLCVLVLFLFTQRREAILLAAIALCGTALGMLSVRQAAQSCLSFSDGAVFSVAGVLETKPDDAVRTVRLRTDAYAACRSLRVRLPDDAPELNVGDAVRVSGTWMIQSVGAQPAGMLIVSAVQRLPAQPHSLLAARGRMQQRLRALFPHTYPLAEALLVAQTEGISPEVKQDFAASGLTHLLAISGSHVALIAGALLLLARLLRCSQRAAAIVSVVGSAAYVFFLGAPAAALRALIQMVLLFAARALQKPAHPLGLLAVACVVITALDARSPLDAGFQLSFAGIFGIVMWRRPLIERMPALIPAALRDAIATTLAATAITTPIAAYQFGMVSVVALVSNLFAGPVVSLAVPMAGAALALSYVSMSAAHFIAGGTELVLFWLSRIAHISATVPYGHFFVAPRTVIFATTGALLAYSAARKSYRSTNAGRLTFAAIVSILPLTLSPLLPISRSNLEIHMIDVGQGDAFAIRTPRGRWLLVDAGPVSDRFDAGKARVVPFLLQHGAERIDFVLLSHPHLDHFGGLQSIAQRIPVAAIIDPAMPVPSPPFDSLLGSARAHHTRWLVARSGELLVVDGVRVEFLAPDSVSLDPAADPNDFSAAFRLTYGSFHALFVGDLYVAEEQQLIAKYGAGLDVDLLKVAHHGSASSSSAAFLQATTPAVALVSVGRRNHYGHPDAGTMARLRAVGAQVFRSDQDGTVSVFVTPQGRVSVARAAFR